MRSVISKALGAAAIMTAIVLPSGTASRAAEMCSNHERRIEQGANFLSDCRAWELVSPEGARPNIIHSATGESAVGWQSYYPPVTSAGQYGGAMYLSRRSESQQAWRTLSVTPPQSPTSAKLLNCEPSMYFSPTLARGVLSDGLGSISLAGDGNEACSNHNEPPLVTEPSGWQSEPEGFQNLFFAGIGEEGPFAWRLVNRIHTSVAPGDAWLQDGSTEEGQELSHVVFSEYAKLTEDAPAGEDLYEWVDGVVRLVTYLPNGQPTTGNLANGSEAGEAGENTKTAAAFTNAMSKNGSRVFFTSQGNLYVRLHADQEPLQGAVAPAECVASREACTIQVDASKIGGPGGGGLFLAADTTGTRVFFAANPSAGLTLDTEEGSGLNLYELNVDTGLLTDLTGHESSVNVLGITGFGEEADGNSHLYFVATGALGGAGVAGRPNLYVASGTGQITYIATLNWSDSNDWSNSLLTSRVSPSGRAIVFTSLEAEALANYDSAGFSEIFLYRLEESTPTCVSCAWGATPNGPSTIEFQLPAQNRRGPAFLNRYVLDDGRVFFTSPDRLVNEDINGVADAYEYHNGHVYLISSGTDSHPSTFEDASTSGTDVYFETDAQLLPSDASSVVSLYDARERGGFSESTPQAECAAEGCRRSVPAGTPFVSPASITFIGAGNVSRATRPKARLRGCRRHFGKKKGRCVRRKTNAKRRRGKKRVNKPARGRK